MRRDAASDCALVRDASKNPQVKGVTEKPGSLLVLFGEGVKPTAVDRVSRGKIRQEGAPPKASSIFSCNVFALATQVAASRRFK
ncbi:MAG: hypothetical protein ABSG23_17530 [Terriglobales bacterium]|jgi:hypothetical protein